MKIRVAFTVDIDAEAWDLNYDTGTSPAAVRADVQAYVAEAVREQLRSVGALANPPLS